MVEAIAVRVSEKYQIVIPRAVREALQLQQAMQDDKLFLTGFPNLQLAPPDVPLARETAWVRAATARRTPTRSRQARRSVVYWELQGEIRLQEKPNTL
jgi:hypothetical protein